MSDGGWVAICKRHMKQTITDIESSGNVFNGYADADRRMRCDFPECKERADYEVFWGRTSWDELIKKGRFVPLDAVNNTRNTKTI